MAGRRTGSDERHRSDPRLTHVESGREALTTAIGPLCAGRSASPNEKDISWAYFSGGFNAAARFDNGWADPIDVLIGTGGDWYCDICNPFQHATSITGDPAQRQEHIKDVIDFFDELDHGHLRAVSYVKPDSWEIETREPLGGRLQQRILERIQEFGA